MKRIFSPFAFALSMLLAFLPAKAAQAGQWNYYLAYQNATQVCPVGQMVYGLFDGNLLSYDTKTEEVHLFSRNDGLTGKNIIHMAYCAPAKALFLVYDDLGIDVLGRDGSVVFMPQLKESYSGISTVNDLKICGTTALLAMSDGVVMADVKNGEFKSYYKLGKAVYSAIIHKDQCFASTDNGILACPLSRNMADPSQWTTVASEKATDFTVFAEAVYYNVREGSGKGFWRFTIDKDGKSITPAKIADPVFPQLCATAQTMLAKSGEWLFVYDKSNPFGAQTALQVPEGCQTMAVGEGGLIWSASGFGGLRAYQIKDGAWADQGVKLGGYGPKRDLCYYLRFHGNRLLVAGGRLDPYDKLHYSGTVMVRENRAWRAFQEDGISSTTSLPYRDITCVAQDPSDSSRVFASAGGTGLYEFKSGRFVKNYSLSNSTLLSAAKDGNPNYVRVDGLNFDAAGNLWMVNNEVDSVVSVLKTNGKWKRIYVAALQKHPTLEKTLFDRSGRFWIASRRTVAPLIAGLACLDYKGTIDNAKDDVVTFRSSAYNQDGTSCDLSQGVYAIAEDRDGALWIGAATGVYVISDPDEWADTNFRITQVKVPRNDGTNYADYLLEGVAVNDICVDGANRKWMATLSNGVYLVSADGTEIIHHFLSSNSPLLSDVVNSVAVDPATGEVFFGTDAGLCSFQGDATQPSEALSKNEVKVYPNPVRPEYSGNITVTGLTENADVKITTTGGQVVAAGTSHGGMFIWDGRNMAGARVPTGVYYIMCATQDGSKGIAAKVVVI